MGHLAYKGCLTGADQKMKEWGGGGGGGGGGGDMLAHENFKMQIFCDLRPI